jgi:hypothetical protein
LVAQSRLRTGRYLYPLRLTTKSLTRASRVTQNIDGLHQASGIADDQVIELHGNSTYAHCLDCWCPLNTRFHWTGHLLQGRFGAVVMDEPHLLAAARYIMLNPVVAGLVSHAADWPWSSARAHLAGEDDELATVVPLRALISYFAALLVAPADPATTPRIERAPTIGRPLGSPEWVAALERQLGRALAPGKPRPKPGVDPAPRGNHGCCENSSKLLP